MQDTYQAIQTTNRTALHSSMITDKQEILSIIDACITQAYKEGRIASPNRDNVFGGLYYPFKLHHIAGIYTTKTGYGSGVWFVLDDDSIWDQYGQIEQTGKDGFK